MRKELTVFIQTNEEGEEIKVSRVTTEPGFMLLTLGQNRMVVNVEELIEAIQSIGHYSVLFDEEQRRREQRDASSKNNPCAVIAAAPENFNPIVKRAKTSKNKEDEGALILPAELRQGPTASELALEQQTKHMKGETLVVVEK